MSSKPAADIGPLAELARPVRTEVRAKLKEENRRLDRPRTADVRVTVQLVAVVNVLRRADYELRSTHGWRSGGSIAIEFTCGTCTARHRVQFSEHELAEAEDPPEFWARRAGRLVKSPCPA